jgi:F-type H+-transporting ATPase subunit delta
LDETLRAEVINFIKKHGNDNVELTEKVDENIIGGAIIRMGDKQLDASVSKTISELRQSFNSNLYLQDF